VIVLALLLHPAPLAADDTGRSLESALLTNGVEHPEVHAEEEAIALVYRALAGGPAGPEEVMFWSRRISDRGGRLELAWMLAQETLVSQHITTLYRETLGREPHPDELAYWTRHASGPGRLADTAILILSSEEARTRAVSNNAYVAMLYRNALGRDVDEDWLRYWVGNIERVGAADAARALWNASARSSKPGCGKVGRTSRHPVLPRWRGSLAATAVRRSYSRPLVGTRSRLLSGQRGADYHLSWWNTVTPVDEPAETTWHKRAGTDELAQTLQHGRSTRRGWCVLGAR
jgi:hypothetical protein